MLVRVAEADIRKPWEPMFCSILQCILRAIYSELFHEALRRSFYFLSSEMHKSLGSWVWLVPLTSLLYHILCGFPQDRVETGWLVFRGRWGQPLAGAGAGAGAGACWCPEVTAPFPVLSKFPPSKSPETQNPPSLESYQGSILLVNFQMVTVPLGPQRSPSPLGM